MLHGPFIAVVARTTWPNWSTPPSGLSSAATRPLPPISGSGTTSGTGRALVVLKAAIVDAEFGRLDLKLRTLRGRGRVVSTTAYEAGGVAGASLAINPGIRETWERMPQLRRQCIQFDLALFANCHRPRINT
jgi:hypothetical protein